MSEKADVPIWEDGKAYENFMGQWSRLAGRKFVEWIDPPQDIGWLEVGCGTGAFTHVILDEAAPREVVGLDNAEAQLAFARERVSAKNVTFRSGDALDLPFADGAFDIAVSALVLNFVPDQEKMVSEMRRVVRPNGQVALYVFDFAGRKGTTQHILDAIAARDPEADKRGTAGLRVHTTNPEYLLPLFKGGGLVDVETHAIEIDVRFRDFDVYWSSNTEFASPHGQYVDRLTAEEREQFIAEVKQRLPMSDDGSIEYVARLNAVRGIVPP